jgi:putative Mn2+ efflux pump MntP
VKLLEKLIVRGVEKGCFETEDPFLAANIIGYLVMIEPMRGWNLKDRYSAKELAQSITGFILKMLGVREAGGAKGAARTRQGKRR